MRFRRRNAKDKKFKAVIDDERTIHFGSEGASDITLNRDKARKQMYIDRHRRNEGRSDPTTAGFYAKRALWNKPTKQDPSKTHVKGIRHCA